MTGNSIVMTITTVSIHFKTAASVTPRVIVRSLGEVIINQTQPMIDLPIVHMKVIVRIDRGGTEPVMRCSHGSVTIMLNAEDDMIVIGARDPKITNDRTTASKKISMINSPMNGTSMHQIL